MHLRTDLSVLALGEATGCLPTDETSLADDLLAWDKGRKAGDGDSVLPVISGAEWTLSLGSDPESASFGPITRDEPLVATCGATFDGDGVPSLSFSCSSSNAVKLDRGCCCPADFARAVGALAFPIRF